MIWKLFVQKLVKTAVQAALAWVSADRLATWGVTVDETTLVAATYTTLEALRQYLKHKVGLKFL